MTPSATGKGPFHALATALLGNPQEKPAAPGEKKGELTALPELRDGAFAAAEALGDLLSHGDASAALVVLDRCALAEHGLDALHEVADRDLAAGAGIQDAAGRLGPLGDVLPRPVL